MQAVQEVGAGSVSSRKEQQAYDFMWQFGLQHQRERAVYEWLIAEARWWANTINQEWGRQEGVAFEYYNYDEIPLPEWLR